MRVGAIADEVAVVTVTYGRRGTYVQALLAGLACGNIRPAACIIVDNGSHEDLDTICAEAQVAMCLHVLHLGDNTGSAAGFAAGIRLACERGYERIWLLDDDNVPEPSALSVLLDQLHIEGSQSARTCLAGLRLDREKYLKAAVGERTMAFSATDSFMGFSLTSRLCTMWYGVRGVKSVIDTVRVRPIDVAIFGGLMIPASAVKAVGLPDDRYFLYFDDREYTTRLTISGFPIKLVPRARIKDLENSWATTDGVKVPWAFSPTASNAKVYYMVRNGVHYDRSFIIRHSAVYLLNAIVYISVVTAVALLKGVGPTTLAHRLRLIWRAFRDGWQGRLGKANSLS